MEQSKKKMLNEELKNEMLTALYYLRGEAMKDWFDKNLLKLVFVVWFAERIYYYTAHTSYFKSFCDYVEMVLGGM